MLTRLAVRNFKRFDEVEIELGQSVVFIGPNNSGKTTALQALSLWQTGLKAWRERRTSQTQAQERVGVSLNRRALTQIPVREVRDLFHDRRTIRNKEGLQNRLEVEVTGQDSRGAWRLGLRCQYASPESLLVSPIRVDGESGTVPVVPVGAEAVRIAFLPPMAGLAVEEPEWAPGRVDVLLGEGQTAQVLRNLCLRVLESSAPAWLEITADIKRMFGATLLRPERDPARGTVDLRYREARGVEFDIGASGRGLQQVLLLLAHLHANQGSVLVLDEPDAHLEILRQRQIYQLLTERARATSGQIIAASHSEILLNEAAERDVVVAFVGQPHRVDDRGLQVLKSLRDIGFEQYVQAEARGWVLYLEGSTDLAILRAWARVLDHPTAPMLSDPFVSYVGNNHRAASHHYFGLREAKPDLRAFALFDRMPVPPDFVIPYHAWKRREIENYLSAPDVLRRHAAGEEADDLVGQANRARRTEAMDAAIAEVEAALLTLGEDPWSDDLKASERLLPPIFMSYFRKLGVPDRTNKSGFHVLASAMLPDEIPDEVRDVLDRMLAALIGPVKS